jgi:hypothetical protein
MENNNSAVGSPKEMDILFSKSNVVVQPSKEEAIVGSIFILEKVDLACSV